MATADAHQPPSRYIFPQSAPLQPGLRPTTSHYRPVSQLLSDETGAPKTRPIKFSRRSSMQSFLSNHLLLEMVRKPNEESKGNKAQIPTRTSTGKSTKPVARQARPRLGTVKKASPNASDITPKANHDNMIYRTEDVYVAKKGWHSYGRMKLHPYSNDAVYMQSYDPIILENEKYNYLLLRRLASSVPTFSMPMKRPPSSVLDLGCGQGHWMLDAANFWPNTNFTGFDLMDILLPEVQQRASIRLVRGNFVKYPLPFPDKSFDLVRMANLSLAIPYDQWGFVVSEARRILRVGGQLEIIDDELFFPYGPFPVRAPSSSQSRWRNNWASNGPRNSRVVGDEGESDASSSTLGENEDNSPGRTPKKEEANHFKSEPLRAASVDPQRCLMTYLQQWASHYQIARGIEDSFVSMLQQRSVHLAPQEFVPDLLRQIFGYKNCSNTQTYDIKLAPASSWEADQPGKTNVDNLFWSNQRLAEPTENDGRHSLGSDGDSPTPPIPPQHSAKAAGRLGISYSDLVAATAATAAVRRQVTSGARPHQRPVTRRSSQSPGIIVSPSTFIPLTPIETEFYTCKWIHTVLGCKPAIVDHVQSHDDQIGREAMDDVELNNALWTYESFRRQRFHWPSDPEQDPESFASPSISNTCKSDTHQFFEGPDSESVHIRTIRVYHATRTETTSLASRLFPNNNASRH